MIKTSKLLFISTNHVPGPKITVVTHKIYSNSSL
jgi:hypothetical protein